MKVAKFKILALLAKFAYKWEKGRGIVVLHEATLVLPFRKKIT